MRESSGRWDREPLWGSEAARTRLRGAAPEPLRGDPPASGDEPGARTSRRALRPGRTPAGIVVALLVSVAGWAATAELIWLMLGGRPRWGPLDRVGALGARTWGDPVVGVLACLLVLGGVVLVVHALTPGRPRLIPLRTRDPLLAIGLTRSGLRRALTAAVHEVDGVAAARVAVRADRVEVVVRTPAGRTGELLPRVAAAVGDTLVRVGAEAGREVVLRMQAGRG
ncbi:MAG: DUF6286 domain-containing protein [Actinomycetes bacterium]|jgi:hypothetical protein|nr:MAG: alkaline shock response membrane anchor protein AmaP [Actinomycetota bacterium]